MITIYHVQFVMLMKDPRSSCCLLGRHATQDGPQSIMDISWLQIINTDAQCILASTGNLRCYQTQDKIAMVCCSTSWYSNVDHSLVIQHMAIAVSCHVQFALSNSTAIAFIHTHTCVIHAYCYIYMLGRNCSNGSIDINIATHYFILQYYEIKTSRIEVLIISLY